MQLLKNRFFLLIISFFCAVITYSHLSSLNNSQKLLGSWLVLSNNSKISLDNAIQLIKGPSIVTSKNRNEVLELWGIDYENHFIKQGWNNVNLTKGTWNSLETKEIIPVFIGFNTAKKLKVNFNGEIKIRPLIWSKEITLPRFYSGRIKGIFKFGNLLDSNSIITNFPSAYKISGSDTAGLFYSFWGLGPKSIKKIILNNFTKNEYKRMKIISTSSLIQSPYNMFFPKYNLIFNTAFFLCISIIILSFILINRYSFIKYIIKFFKIITPIFAVIISLAPVYLYFQQKHANNQEHQFINLNKNNFSSLTIGIADNSYYKISSYIIGMDSTAIDKKWKDFGYTGKSGLNEIRQINKRETIDELLDNLARGNLDIDSNTDDNNQIVEAVLSSNIMDELNIKQNQTFSLFPVQSNANYSIISNQPEPIKIKCIGTIKNKLNLIIIHKSGIKLLESRLSEDELLFKVRKLPFYKIEFKLVTFFFILFSWIFLMAGLYISRNLNKT